MSGRWRFECGGTGGYVEWGVSWGFDVRRKWGGVRVGRVLARVVDSGVVYIFFFPFGHSRSVISLSLVDISITPPSIDCFTPPPIDRFTFPLYLPVHCFIHPSVSVSLVCSVYYVRSIPSSLLPLVPLTRLYVARHTRLVLSLCTFFFPFLRLSGWRVFWVIFPHSRHRPLHVLVYFVYIYLPGSCVRIYSG